MKRFLGVDTSNYTTSLSVSENGKIVSNLKTMLNVADGQRGLRQSDAVFAHTVNLPKLFCELEGVNPSAVGVSAYPRDVEGSYMPCFLAGVSAATAVANASGVPLYHFSHQMGHIAAALYSVGREDLIKEKFLAFHVSGGTTELLFVDNMKITLLGGTKDISAGKAIDRTGVLLGLKFPCGRELETLAGDITDKVKIDKISVKGLECNLSGLENKVMGLIKANVDREYIAAYTISTICAVIDKLTENALGLYPDIPVIYSGGVMSNRFIKDKLSCKYNGFFAEPEFSCDNAAGIARLAELKYLGEI